MRLITSFEGISGCFEINSTALALAWAHLARADDKMLHTSGEATPPAVPPRDDGPNITRIDNC